MSVPGYSLGRKGDGTFGEVGPGSGYDGMPTPRLDSDDDRKTQPGYGYDGPRRRLPVRPNPDKDRGGSATNRNVNTVTGGNVTIGDVGSNNVTRINAKNKAQEFKKKKEAAESEEAKADTDADVSNEAEKKAENKFETQEIRGIPERSITVRNPDSGRGGFRDYGYGGPTDRRDGRAGRGGDANFGYRFSGSGGYNFNRGGGRTPMRRGAGIRRTGRG